MANWFITGVSSGLGAALAQALLDRGDTVVGTVRQSAAQSRFAQLAPGRSHALLLDVIDEAAVHAALAKAEMLTGGLDYVVNNAGHGMTGAIEETGLAQARALFDVNVFGAMAVIQAALPYMRARRRGHIVNITSVSGLAAWAGTALYGASKFALECLGRTLAQEVAPLGIKVTNVAPGGLKTHFAGAGLIDADKHIEDYATTAHIARPTLLGGHEPSDVTLAADAILNALADDEPPLLLLLGPDALKYAEYEFAMLADQISKWKPLTLSTVAEPAEAAA
jgi:NAD(P)-dependent dehydrogenase (short-subunit alcohol dehydrogenase family)